MLVVAAVVTSLLFVTPAAATYDGGTDDGPEKIEQIECPNLVDVKCTAVRADIRIRNNMIENLEANRDLAEDWEERGREWQESDFETKEGAGEYATEKAESTHNRIDSLQELLRNNTMPELIPKLVS